MKKVFRMITVSFVLSVFICLGAMAVYAADAGTVRDVQQALNDAGYNCGTVDGIIGPKTSGAISKYQTDQGLNVDGMVSDALIESLGISASEAAGKADKDIYGLLIIGSDRRDKTWNGNADAIILATINRKTQKIIFTSFCRDTYAEIPGYGARKINHAYAVGGGELLSQTIRNNFGLQVDNFVAGDWPMAAAAIDLFGGVEIDVKDYELSQLKSCISGVCRMIGVNAADYQVTAAGLQHLNGAQAVAYSRIRKAGNGDYERTERQRRVLTYLLEHLSLADLAAVTQRLDDTLADLSHNFSAANAVALAAQYAAVKNYEIVSTRIPYDGMHYTSNEMLVPSQPETNEKLKAEIYG